MGVVCKLFHYEYHRFMLYDKNGNLEYDSGDICPRCDPEKYAEECRRAEIHGAL